MGMTNADEKKRVGEPRAAYIHTYSTVHPVPLVPTYIVGFESLGSNELLAARAELFILLHDLLRRLCAALPLAEDREQEAPPKKCPTDPGRRWNWRARNSGCLWRETERLQLGRCRQVEVTLSRVLIAFPNSISAKLDVVDTWTRVQVKRTSMRA